ncbi:MAG: hypothetical protein H7A25_07890 [Leptospiraceae bacterium]|nr:hypothetical protein [Leptospiraceae bacterium]
MELCEIVYNYMKKFLSIVTLLLFSCLGEINYNNVFEPSPGLLLHYLWLQTDKTPP